MRPKKKKNNDCTEPWKRCFLSAFCERDSRRSETRTNAFPSFFLSFIPRTSVKVALNFIETICTDLLCWIYFVPFCSGSGDESINVKLCNLVKTDFIKLVSKKVSFRNWYRTQGIDISIDNRNIVRFLQVF